MNEADTRAELIDPALKEAGWGVASSSWVRREVITLGRMQGTGQRTRGDIADYVLFYKGQKQAVIEAKSFAELSLIEMNFHSQINWQNYKLDLYFYEDIRKKINDLEPWGMIDV